MYCVNTPDTSIGGRCTVDYYNPFPGPKWFEGQRGVVEITPLEVSDGGPDGQIATGDNTVCLRQGIFVL